MPAWLTHWSYSNFGMRCAVQLKKCAPVAVRTWMAVCQGQCSFLCSKTMPLICILFVVRALGLVGMLKSRGPHGPVVHVATKEDSKFRWRTRIQAEGERYCFVHAESSQTFSINGWRLDVVVGEKWTPWDSKCVRPIFHVVPFHDGFVDAGPQKAVFGLQANCGCNMFLDVCCIMLYHVVSIEPVGRGWLKAFILSGACIIHYSNKHAKWQIVGG